MPQLIFIDPQFAGQTYKLDREKTKVGRGDDNDLIVPDASVSIHHCVFLVNGPEVLVCELDSSNGTYVDGVRVGQQSPINSGQIVRFGSAAARLNLGLEDEASDAEELTAIRSHLRALRKGPVSSSPPDITPTKLRSPAPADSDEPTVMSMPLPPPQRPVAAPQFKSDATSHSGAGTSSARLWWILVLAGMALMAAAAYWMLTWRR